MKYRIQKEIYTRIDGSENITYYPQHKHWWCPWWHYFGIFDAYSDYVFFDTFEKAENYIEWEKSEYLKYEHYEI